MKVFAISDLHLSTVVDKPMDVFGTKWDNYVDRIFDDWRNKVGEDDVVLLCGDFSWAMTLEEVKPDFALVAPLPGKKVILRGNHDYWWSSYAKVKSVLPEGFYAVQNNCLRFGDLLLCGSRGWLSPSVGASLSKQDEVIFKREVIRLEMSLDEMDKMRLPTDTVMGMMHYPPFDALYSPGQFVSLFVKHNVDKVVYGHLHGKDSRADLTVNKFGVSFFLTSCDKVDFSLTLIADV